MRFEELVLKTPASRYIISVRLKEYISQGYLIKETRENITYYKLTYLGKILAKSFSLIFSDINSMEGIATSIEQMNELREKMLSNYITLKNLLNVVKEDMGMNIPFSMEVQLDILPILDLEMVHKRIQMVLEIIEDFEKEINIIKSFIDEKSQGDDISLNGIMLASKKIVDKLEPLLLNYQTKVVECKKYLRDS
ncbi:MAG: hypothetical protein OEY49_07840 [Candidatus Heimdallarchaeota archaeon]|nr:hypothetical protein [Candidatus Heimdallarchaeota archaeon]